MKSIIHLTAIVAAVVLFSSCTKEAGPAGPAGAAGATGATGAAGSQGNANVQSFEFPAQNFTTNQVLTFSVPAITQLVIDSGAVVIYSRLTNGSQQDGWTELPFIFESEFIASWDVYPGYASVYANFNSSSIAPFDFKVTVIGGQ